MIINKELNFIKEELKNSFVELLPKNTLKDFLLSGSKFIRSSVTILYLKAQNIEITDDIYKILVAGELIHSSSLLHDDVIDEAEIRRGKSTIAKLFTPKISILSGDFLLSIAIEKLLNIDNFDILTSFKDCVKTMTETEIKQYFLRGQTPSENDYIQICKGKTAILFSTILENATKYTTISSDHAKLFGEHFGIYFQIKNDLNLESAKEDKNNSIHTAKDVLGIEKTNDLLDNYIEKMSMQIKDFPENIYKKELERLIKTL